MSIETVPSLTTLFKRQRATLAAHGRRPAPRAEPRMVRCADLPGWDAAVRACQEREIMVGLCPELAGEVRIPIDVHIDARKVDWHFVHSVAFLVLTVQVMHASRLALVTAAE